MEHIILNRFATHETSLDILVYSITKLELISTSCQESSIFSGRSHLGSPRLLEILKRFNEDADAAIMFAITGAETELVRKRDARCVQLNES